MKKIISTLALATLAFGASFADVKFTCNYRTQAVAFSRVMKADSYSATANGEKFQTYMLSNTAYGGDSDTFKMSASNDFGGVNVRIDPKGSNGTLTLNEYNAYVKAGAFTLTAGYWKDGVMNGAYQLKNDADASNLGGETFAAYKLGSMFKKAITLQVDDITSFAGSAHATGYISYLGEFDALTLKADLAAVSLDGATTWDGSNYYSGLAARIDARLETWDIQFVIKQANITNGQAQRALALHVQPLAWGALKATFGGSLGFYEGELTEYNADIRFRYADGPLSVTFFTNLSRITDYGATKMDVKDYNKHVGAYFLSSANKWTAQSNAASHSAMWNMLAIRFKVSDKLFLTGELGDIVGFKSAGKVFGDYGVEAFVAPGFQVFAGKNCSVSTCLRIGLSNLLMDSDKYKDIEPAMSMAVPVVMRVKL
ncbi:hypothetical protein [uncultured Treponema sp.]|uniref:hypothetical protein n=1 Tax=uncultured Treponema sp. TaxID=162155 RepID=UPI0025D880E9|nr:hypothetical protein [uncultured Treponema sp.]